ncbi:hypothetical protein LCGC14_2304170 [marine sediment metagenome]|uniref:Uncharacterized protein n=1 Tax=marine sediment metagenome TaxID=412755 RepID=A0A0F9CN18_9ZZZZ
MTQPVIEAGDITSSNNETSETSQLVSYPAYEIGDLLIQFYMGDDDIDDTITPPGNGGNGETLILTTSGSGGNSTNGPVSGIVAWVGDASKIPGTLEWTRGAAEQWAGRCVKVLAGEFDPTTPLAVVSGYDGSPIATTDCATPTWAIGAGDAGGTVVVGFCIDIQPITVTPGGWTLLVHADHGAIASAVAVRDAATSASETIASVDFTIAANRTSSTIAVVVRPPAAGGANPKGPLGMPLHGPFGGPI